MNPKDIIFISRKEIDVDKYNNCIKNSIESRIYAYSWYLDAVAENWSVLSFNDYEIVMPIPWKSKYGIKYIYTPPWIQQLGVFSKKERLSENQLEQFIKRIPSYFFKIELSLNSSNVLENCHPNYILYLDKSYDLIYEGYRKLRARNLERAKKQQIKVSIVPLDKVLRLHANEKPKEIKTFQANFVCIKALFHSVSKYSNIHVLGCENEDGDLMGGAVFLMDSKRITYLFSIVNKEGKAKNVMTLIIDEIIKENANSSLILDFEGSSIKGVATFFKSFGAINEPYYSLRKAPKILSFFSK